MFGTYFQLGPIPADAMSGVYSIKLVILSYIVATGASYVALDITNRMRDVGVTPFASFIWLLGGSVAMGAGIWSMHFIGMLAFVMDMPMTYSPGYTALSMIIAVVASGFALSLLRAHNIKVIYLILGGVILGLAIASMHYVGMAAMEVSMHIKYLPSIFALSILIAIIASEAALYLALLSARVTISHRFILKIASAMVMGAAICGMHYTGMAAAVFTPLHTMSHVESAIEPDTLSVLIAIVTIFILSIAITISSFKEAMSAKAVNIARQAGMAEVASHVLHNVGNVLNSVNVGITYIGEHLNKVDLDNLSLINKMFEENKSHLSQFIISDKGEKAIDYLAQLTKQWQHEFRLLKNELHELSKNVQHIKDIISVQQNYSTSANFSEFYRLEQIFDEVLSIILITYEKSHINVRKEFDRLKPVYVDKLKLNQILINLLRNAKESLLASNVPNKILTIQAGLETNNTFFIKIIDNGVGVDPKNKSRIFTQGFTTKKEGHGFGLHASIIAARSMQGSLTMESGGIDQGAEFKLVLPYLIEHESSRENDKADFHRF